MRVGVAATLFAFVTMFIVPSEAGLAERGIMPSDEQYVAPLRAKRCSVYRYLVKRSEGEIQNSNKTLIRHKRALKLAYDSLLACGKRKGLVELAGQEVLLAELCPEAYNQWLKPSYRIHVVNMDLDASKSTLKDAASLIRHQCGVLPTPVSASTRY